MRLKSDELYKAYQELDQKLQEQNREIQRLQEELARLTSEEMRRKEEGQRGEGLHGMFSEFLGKHGSEASCDKLLAYLYERLGSAIFQMNCWKTDEDSLRYAEYSSCHSFFDSGGGVEEYFQWRLTYVPEPDKTSINNEQLEQFKKPYFGTQGREEKSVLCKDPWDLHGVFEVYYLGYRENTD